MRHALLISSLISLAGALCISPEPTLVSAPGQTSASISPLMSESYLVGAVRVRGYTRRNGTYVMPHYRSAPDGYRSNNYSSYGNLNPYTGGWGRTGW